MSDSAERPMEAEPLKGDQADGVCKDRGAGCGKLGMNKLTGWRTAAFLLSLFLCLIVVFAFSFILPCPLRPQYLRTWNRTLPNAGFSSREQNSWFHQLWQVVQVLKQQSILRPSHYHHHVSLLTASSC
ncbi:hypothetical protein SRHO_G00049120 [Serrasalmus rhombeus]